MKNYNREKNVYEAAIERFDYIFDHYDTIVVSCSGGKDSTATAYLALETAKRKSKPFYLFYLDQEMEYKYTIEFIEYIMQQELVIPIWFQIYARLPNPSSINDNIVDPWNPEKENVWIRQKNDLSKKQIDWDVKQLNTNRFKEKNLYGFYGLIGCMEQMFKDKNGQVAQILGIRADESLDRFRATTKTPGIDGIRWSTKRKYNINFYPIYDWRFSDIWKYLGVNDYRYNKIYDLFYWRGMNPNKMRLANLIHTKSYECLRLLQEFEPETVDKLLDRISGLATAQEYAGRSGGIYKADKLPPDFKTWIEFRDYLLETLPNREHARIFKERFEKQYQNDYVVKQQVNRILITDVNNYKPIMNKEFDPTVKIREKWMEIL